MQRHKVTITLVYITYILLFSSLAYAKNIRCYDIDKLRREINDRVCHQVCVKTGAVNGSWEKKRDVCICGWISKYDEITEAGITILNPLETNLSSSPFYDTF